MLTYVWFIPMLHEVKLCVKTISRQICGQRELHSALPGQGAWRARRALREAANLELRSEFFNLFNTPQFNNPNATVGTVGFGTISSAGSPNTLQRVSREVQLAAKVVF